MRILIVPLTHARHRSTLRLEIEARIYKVLAVGKEVLHALAGHVDALQVVAEHADVAREGLQLVPPHAADVNSVPGSRAPRTRIAKGREFAPKTLIHSVIVYVNPSHDPVH
jgi:hypothetical protein